MNAINVGLWGIGRAGWNMHCSELDRFADCFHVVAGCDRISERAADLAARYPGARAYTDGEEFLRDPAIELVSIAVPSLLHLDYAERALRAGKYVFLEKPFGLNESDADRLLQLDRDFPGRLFLRYNRRFEAALHHLRSIMTEGLLGTVYEIKLCRHRFQLRNDWQTLVECGGGQLNNWGPHLIDHALILLDSPLAKLWADRKRVAALGTAEDHIKIIFTGTNGRIVDLEISDGVTLPGPVYTVYGTRGTLVCDDESTFHLKYLDPAFSLPPLGSKKESPARNSGYGGEIPVKWIDTVIPVSPADHADMADIYGRVYQTIREGVPFTVTAAQAAEVIRVTAQVRAMAPICPVNG